MFVHIPKTAGASLLASLRQTIPGDATALYYPPGMIENFSALKSKGLVAGHFSLNMIHDILPSSSLVTLLRQPSARVISQLLYDIRFFGQPSWLDLDTPVEQQLLTCVAEWGFWFYDNCQVRMIAGIHDSVSIGELKQEHLELALHNLECFSFVGTQEQYESDLGRLSRALGFELPVFWRNSSNARQPFVQLETTRAASLVAWDNELYARLKSLQASGWTGRRPGGPRPILPD